MKIAFLIISDNFAGGENVVKSIIKNKGNKKNVILITNEEIINHYKDLKIRKYNLGKLFDKNLILRFWNLISISNKLKRIIIKEKIDMINPSLEYSFLILYLNNLNLPIICSLHGEETNNLKIKKKTLQNYIVKKILMKSKHLISVSKDNYSLIPKKYLKKTTIIPNGVDTLIFRKRHRVKIKRNTILFVGRYIELKGIKELVNVAHQLPEYEFLFAGQGPLKDIIKGKKVINMGFKNSKELVNLYNQSAICVFPSHREAFGLVGLEAMACGKPVIATPLGFSEYIENGKDGIIIPAKNEKALKEAIVKLMENPKLRERLGKAARKKAEKYSWKIISKKYISLMENLKV